MLTRIAAVLVIIGLLAVAFAFAMENRRGWAGVMLGAAVLVGELALVLG